MSNNKYIKTTMINPEIDLHQSQTDPSLDDIQKGDTVNTIEAGKDGVTRTRYLEGFTYVRKNPYGWWTVAKHVNGQPLPEQLTATFTTERDVMHAIHKYLGQAR